MRTYHFRGGLGNEFEELSRRFKKPIVFSDLIEMMAISIRNINDKTNWQERESRYLKIINKYNKKEIDLITKIFATIVKEMHKNPRDVLGELYMLSEIGSKELGQFFTPRCLSKIVTNATFNKKEIEKQIKTRGYIKLIEPTVGSGVFIISFISKMISEGFDIYTQIFIEATDLDITAVYMTYIHLSLLGAAAKIKHADTLSNETMDIWETPNFVGRRSKWK